MSGDILRYATVRIMKKFFYPKEKIDELLTDKSTIQIQKSQITDFPNNLPPASHSHTYDSITGKPSTFTPSSHNHTISDVTNLQSSLNAKSDNGHGHRKTDITDFSHTHPISEISDLGNASVNSNGLMSNEDKTKLDNLSYDSGWVDLTVDSYFKSPQKLQARRIGNIVQIQGSIQPKTSGYTMTSYDNTWDVISEPLPAQFRPRRTLTFTQKANTKRFFALYINNSGEMTFGRFSDQGGEYELSASMALSINAMYFK